MIDIELAIPKFQQYWIYCIVGGRGKGKSTIIIDLLNGYLKKYYDDIYLVSTTADKDDKFQPLIEELSEDKKFYNSFSEQIIHEIMDRIDEENDKHKKQGKVPGTKDILKYRSLLIFDDCISELPTSMIRGSRFNKLIVGSRHYKTDIIITTQSFKKLNTLIRKNLDIISLFPSVNKMEIKAFLEELNVDEDTLMNCFDQLADNNDPHIFLTMNFMNCVRPKLFLEFKKMPEIDLKK